MNTFIKLILCSIALQQVQNVVAERLYGLERMERFDLLPNLLEGTQVRQVSTRDRDGGNNDGWFGYYPALYRDDNNEFVLYDDIGAGCLYRIWMTYQKSSTMVYTNQLRFYFDNETTPRLERTIEDFFSATNAPFVYPLTGREYQSSHGYYNYVPLPYRERLKITMSDTNRPFYYNMTYHKFDSPDGIASWTGAEDASVVLSQWNNAGVDPKPTNGNAAFSGTLSVATGTTGVLFSASSPGTIQSLKLDPENATAELLASVWLRMTWDGQSEPAVNVPLGEFFGCGRDEVEVRSLPIGMSTTDDYYCYFPMPYWASAKIEVFNGHAGNLEMPFEIQVSSNSYKQANTGFFCTQYRKETFPNAPGSDYICVDAQGRGHLVGLSLYMLGTGTSGWKGMDYLEGDERIYVDGSLTPSLYGTGTEDYFNSGWYFNQGTFNLPYHGHPYEDHYNDPPPNHTQAYRFHLSDIICFNASLKFGIEHGRRNDQPGTYSSVAYLYMRHACGQVLTADLDLGDGWTEMLYDYQYPTGRLELSKDWNYEGIDDSVFMADEGYHYSNTVAEFTVPLAENAGLLLRRRTDQGIGGQKAHVFIDDAYAGIWYEADHNFSATTKRWLDSEFMVSSNLVAGKASARITIVPVPSASIWNEYRYWVYCIKPFGLVEDSDSDQLPDEWELSLVSALGTLHGGVDSDDDGFSDLDEYISGTHPTNPASFFAIQSGTGFQSELGRLYHLQQTTSLVSNDWITIRANIPGTGSFLELPVATNAPALFQRLQVELP
ncbi:glycoside hydrolase family 172 protein [Pontiella sulfatireligans]|uniref:DUF2961 domain-containing protein n=1 Tax=Pontiella sulfatireligans TaxID=2750658 RepID=A0A6C2UKC8_9BACT|nr:glycoside hydrolase family 172 protein [Pontiella sulfatireligans]VGO19877.1 hypothetical protein SCARR_01937 [Pontiella sulfatireligans]